MIIIYHHSYGTRLHLCLPTMRSNVAHLYWCHKQWSLSTIIVPTYIYFNIPACYYFSSIYAHRPEVHRSAESSVVGLDALRYEQCRFCCRLSCIALRAMLVVRQQLFSLQRFLTLPSTEADQTLPLVYIHSWSIFIVLLYSHLRTAPCSVCVFVCISPLQCSQIIFNDFAKHFDFRSTA